MIPSQRHLFDLPEDIAYLNCAYMSPLMKHVAEAGEAGVRRKLRPWSIRPVDFFTESERARGLFARLIGAGADDVAIVPAASYGIATAAANIPVAQGQRILLLHEQFPSNVYEWQALAARSGGEVVTLRRQQDGDWTRVILEAIDERTALAALPHNLWTDGSLVDLESVGQRLREVGAALVVDATQSLGAMPLSVREVRPDFLVAACYKWLMGPYSVGFLYVDPKWHDGRPLEQNWVTRAGAEDFARLIDYTDGFQPGARRFDMGERSNFALMPAAVAALEQLLEWTPAAIAETLAAKTRAIAGRAEALGLTAPAAATRAPHFLGLGFPKGAPAGLVDTLAARQVFVSVRGASMRVTPHVYNDEHDTERLIEALKAVM